MGDHSTEPIFLAWSIYDEIEKLRQLLDGVDRYRPPTAERPQVDYVVTKESMRASCRHRMSRSGASSTCL